MGSRLTGGLIIWFGGGVDALVDILEDWSVGELLDWLGGELVRLVDLMGDWLLGWLVDWVIGVGTDWHSMHWQ